MTSILWPANNDKHQTWNQSHKKLIFLFFIDYYYYYSEITGPSKVMDIDIKLKIWYKCFIVKTKKVHCILLWLHTNTVLSCIIISLVEICSFPLYTTLAFVWPSTNSTKLSLVQETVLPSTSYCTFLQHLRKIFRSPLKQTVTKKI